MLDDLPILGVCGGSGAGKTALIEAVLPRLLAQGLRVAVVKHSTHETDLGREGNDSERLFRAGADVLVRSPAEGMQQTHEGEGEFPAALRSLAAQYDLVLVEGGQDTPIPKVWLPGPGSAQPPPDLEGLLASLPPGGDRPAAFLALLEPYLRRQWLRTPLYACVLIGGRSTRMGSPKHLLRKDGRTWLERTVSLLRPKAQTVAVIGEGAVPEPLGDLVRLADAPDARGPMAGLLAALRWAPHASWLVAACDLPALSAEALDWLLATRAPGRWATLPRLEGCSRVEPLLAHYDFRAGALLEELAAGGDFALQDLSRFRAVYAPSPPAGLAAAWRNVNSPTDLAGDVPGTA